MEFGDVAKNRPGEELLPKSLFTFFLRPSLSLSFPYSFSLSPHLSLSCSLPLTLTHTLRLSLSLSLYPLLSLVMLVFLHISFFLFISLSLSFFRPKGTLVFWLAQKGRVSTRSNFEEKTSQTQQMPFVPYLHSTTKYQLHTPFP